MTRIMQIGLGPLGRMLARDVLRHPNLELVTAVDSDGEKCGRDVGEVCGLDKKLDSPVYPDIEAAARDNDADVAVLSTVSSIERLAPQVEQCAAAGMSVVSTCEELAYPWTAHSETARVIDETCRRYDVACVGTGVNPGYLMDYLPCTLTALCRRVDRVRIHRVQDASKRRGPFQLKIGAGLTPAEFAERAGAGVVRHVGLTESMHMIAAALGWRLDDAAETIEPVIAEQRLETEHVCVEPGQAAGVEQIGRGTIGGREVIRLVFRAAIGEPTSHDTIQIAGEPSIESTIAGGVNGDVATCAVTLNVAQAIVQASPGLRTMLDLPGVHHRGASA